MSWKKFSRTLVERGAWCAVLHLRLSTTEKNTHTHTQNREYIHNATDQSTDEYAVFSLFLKKCETFIHSTTIFGMFLFVFGCIFICFETLLIVSKIRRHHHWVFPRSIFACKWLLWFNPWIVYMNYIFSRLNCIFWWMGICSKRRQKKMWIADFLLSDPFPAQSTYYTIRKTITFRIWTEVNIIRLDGFLIVILRSFENGNYGNVSIILKVFDLIAVIDYCILPCRARCDNLEIVHIYSRACVCVRLVWCSCKPHFISMNIKLKAVINLWKGMGKEVKNKPHRTSHKKYTRIHRN